MALQRAAEAEARQAVVAYSDQDHQGGETLKWMEETFGSLPRSGCKVEAVPSGFGGPKFEHVRCTFPSLGEMAKEAAAVDAVGRNNNAGKLQSIAMNACSSSCRVCGPRPDPVVDGKETGMAPRASRLCFLANACVCGKEGAEVCVKLSRLCTSMKLEWKGPANTVKLLQGDAVMFAMGHVEKHLIRHAEAIRFFHISDVVQSPFQFAVLEMRAPDDVFRIIRTDQDDWTRLQHSDETMWLYSLDKPLTDWDIAFSLDDELVWRVGWCDVLKSAVNLGTCTPNRVEVKLRTTKLSPFMEDPQ